MRELVIVLADLDSMLGQAVLVKTTEYMSTDRLPLG